VRSRPRRTVFVHSLDRTALVLGSRQAHGIVDSHALRDHGVALLRRRSGGGAVLLDPRAAVWLDLWVPRTDPWWEDDAFEASAWAGTWWVRGLESLGVSALAVHREAAIETEWSQLVCFGSVARGEVTAADRKVVGIAQWRCREGALLHAIAYRSFDWRLLADLLTLEADERERAAAALAAMTVGLEELGIALETSALSDALVDELPDRHTWEVVRSAE
jgi:lipoate---protein ligase